MVCVCRRTATTWSLSPRSASSLAIAVESAAAPVRSHRPAARLSRRTRSPQMRDTAAATDVRVCAWPSTLCCCFHGLWGRPTRDDRDIRRLVSATFFTRCRPSTGLVCTPTAIQASISHRFARSGLYNSKTLRMLITLPVLNPIACSDRHQSTWVTA